MIVLYWATAFLSGAGVLVVEMTAPRALAPWFGQAQFVWTNVIGLVLLGLALGSMVGGRLADRYTSPAALGVTLLAAAGLVAIAAFLPGPVARALLPEKLPLEAAYPFLLQGSFVTTLVCFVPPILLLGAVPPFLVRCAARRLEEVGSRSGQLYGAATLGSIAGTFVTSYVLVPWLRTRGTLLLAAALIAAAALPAFVAAGSKRGGRAAALLALIIGGPVAFSSLRAPSVGANHGALVSELLAALDSLTASAAGAAYGELITATDSRYQHVEVRRRADLAGATVLAIDEGHDSFQSLTPVDGVLTGGLYYDYVNLLALDAIRDGGLRVAILGLGAGTHARQLLRLVGPLCKLTLVGVEIDPEVVELGRRHLDLPDDPRLTIWTDMDARTFVDHCPSSFDLMLVDCYARQSFVPSHVTSHEFFESARRRLAPRGVIALNVFGYGAHDAVVETVVETLASVFTEGVVVASLPETANLLVYGSASGPPHRPTDWATEPWPAELQRLAMRLLAPGQFFVHEGGSHERVIHDDDGWFDRLQELRLAQRASALLARGH